jgi:hypothetical protein
MIVHAMPNATVINVRAHVHVHIHTGVRASAATSNNSVAMRKLSACTLSGKRITDDSVLTARVCTPVTQRTVTQHARTCWSLVTSVASSSAREAAEGGVSALCALLATVVD